MSELKVTLLNCTMHRQWTPYYDSTKERSLDFWMTLNFALHRQLTPYYDSTEERSPDFWMTLNKLIPSYCYLGCTWERKWTLDVILHNHLFLPSRLFLYVYTVNRKLTWKCLPVNVIKLWYSGWQAIRFDNFTYFNVERKVSSECFAQRKY